MASPRSPLAGAASASAVALKSSLGIDAAMAGKQREMAAAGSLPGGRAEQQQHYWKRLSLGGTGRDSGGAGEAGGYARPTELDGGIVVHLGSLLGSVERVKSNPDTTPGVVDLHRELPPWPPAEGKEKVRLEAKEEGAPFDISAEEEAGNSVGCAVV
ncbi:hypothetical protein B296_00001011 [Ensete ventricosum]|uniref:Uncharacterized protein n=1 Tax=Ensete ventricosum TaxID=4639 RepID=A0A426Z6Q7_ENSVE|nr:hypothetical protein B296_00001011 [Ensete ventricosum]